MLRLRLVALSLGSIPSSAIGHPLLESTVQVWDVHKINKMEITKYRLEYSDKLAPQTKHELDVLNQRLQPHLKAYDNSRVNIAYLYTQWRASASISARKYADPFIQELGISRSYMSKLKQLMDWKREHLKDEPVQLKEWFGSHGITTQYALTKLKFIDVVNLWDSGANVSREIVERLKRSQENQLSPPNDEKNTDDEFAAALDSQIKRFANIEDRREHLEYLINFDGLPHINTYERAHLWSSLCTQDDDLLALLRQKLDIDSRFEKKLLEELGLDSLYSQPRPLAPIPIN